MEILEGTSLKNRLPQDEGAAQATRLFYRGKMYFEQGFYQKALEQWRNFAHFSPDKTAILKWIDDCQADILKSQHSQIQLFNSLSQLSRPSSLAGVASQAILDSVSNEFRQELTSAQEELISKHKELEDLNESRQNKVKEFEGAVQSRNWAMAEEMIRFSPELFSDVDASLGAIAVLRKINESIEQTLQESKKIDDEIAKPSGIPDHLESALMAARFKLNEELRALAFEKQKVLRVLEQKNKDVQDEAERMKRFLEGGMIEQALRALQTNLFASSDGVVALKAGLREWMNLKEEILVKSAQLEEFKKLLHSTEYALPAAWGQKVQAMIGEATQERQTLENAKKSLEDLRREEEEQMKRISRLLEDGLTESARQELETPPISMMAGSDKILEGIQTIAKLKNEVKAKQDELVNTQNRFHNEKIPLPEAWRQKVQSMIEEATQERQTLENAKKSLEDLRREEEEQMKRISRYLEDGLMDSARQELETPPISLMDGSDKILEGMQAIAKLKSEVKAKQDEFVNVQNRLRNEKTPLPAVWRQKVQTMIDETTQERKTLENAKKSLEDLRHEEEEQMKRISRLLEDGLTESAHQELEAPPISLMAGADKIREGIQTIAKLKSEVKTKQDELVNAQNLFINEKTPLPENWTQVLDRLTSRTTEQIIQTENEQRQLSAELRERQNFTSLASEELERLVKASDFPKALNVLETLLNTCEVSSDMKFRMTELRKKLAHGQKLSAQIALETEQKRELVQVPESSRQKLLLLQSKVESWYNSLKLKKLGKYLTFNLNRDERLFVLLALGLLLVGLLIVFTR